MRSASPTSFVVTADVVAGFEKGARSFILVACTVMADTVMAYIVMAYTAMA